MIQKFVNGFEKSIASTPVVLSSHIQKHFGPALETVYLKGQLLMMDASILEIAVLKRYGIFH